MMECWKIGILGSKEAKGQFHYDGLDTFRPIIPLFHLSNIPLLG